jgi:transcriptional regulator of nitric oxide reductase
LAALQAEGAPAWGERAGFRARAEAFLLPRCPWAIAAARGACKAAENALESAQKVPFN